MLSLETTGINIGCDLGKMRDYTAFSVAEGQMRNGESGMFEQGVPVAAEHFVIRRLERARLGTDYVAIADRLNELFEKTSSMVNEWNEGAPARREALERELKALEPGDNEAASLLAQIERCGQPVARPQIWLDVTGLGGPFLDFLMREHGYLPVVAVTITSGDRDQQAWVPQGYQELHVGKEALVGRLQVLLGSGRITIAQADAARELEHELKVFEGRVTSAQHVKYEAKEGEHDDLVIACALSVWQRAQTMAERVQVW